MVGTQAITMEGSHAMRERQEAMADLFEGYENAMKEATALDFDDLLIYGLRLFQNHPRVIANIENVLIDEFQDTNSTQYEIIKAIATSGCLTTVGDPDQSIYAWRSANVENLAIMVKGALDILSSTPML